MRSTGLLAVVLVFTSLRVLCAEESASQRYGVILEVQGQVEVKIGSQDWQPAQAGMKLLEKDEIRTGMESAAKILLDEQGRTGKLDLKPESRMRLGTLKLDPKSGDKLTVLDLALGSVLVKAEKLQGGSKFQVRTPNATTGVRGTEFLVSVDSES